MNQRAHGSCTYCQARIEQCIYRYFGPCRFDAAENAMTNVEGTGTAATEDIPQPDSLATDEPTGREPENTFEEILKLL